MLSAANRDPSMFPDPDRLNISRKPNRHIGFGHGIHLCSGAALARLEGEIALQQLITRYPAMELATNELTWLDSIVFRGVESLPIAV